MSDSRDPGLVLYDPQGRALPMQTGTTQHATPPGVARMRPVDLAQQIAAYNPGNRPYDPGAPLAPITRGGEPIQWAPQTGYNLIYSPNKKVGVDNATLRQFADACPGLRVVMTQIFREMQGYGLSVARRGLKKSERAKVDPIRDRLESWLKMPDGRRPYGEWLTKVLEDLYVIGAPALARVITASGQPAGLKPIDAGLITPIVTSSGDAPEPPNPAFYFTAYQLPYREYTSDELIYLPYHARTWTPFGFSIVEQAMLYIILQVNRALYYINFYDSSSVPPGIANVPETWTPAEIREFQGYFDQLYGGGNTGQRHKVWWAPPTAKYQAIKQHPDWQYDFDEYLLRVFAWFAGVAPTPIVKTTSMGKGSEGLNQEALAAGVSPLKGFIGSILDSYIHDTRRGLTADGASFPMGFGLADYSIEWTQEREENKDTKLAEDTQLMDRGVYSINRILESRGEDPWDETQYPLAAEPLIKTQSGYIPLSMLQEQADKAVAPPQPVPAAFAKPGGEPPNGPEGGNGAPKPFPVAPDKEAEAKADLGKWRRVVLNAARDGKRPRRFESAALPKALMEHIQKHIDAGDAQPFEGVSIIKADGDKPRPRFADLKHDHEGQAVMARGEQVMLGAYGRMARAVADEVLARVKAPAQHNGDA